MRDNWLDHMGGEYLEGSGFENEPPDAPELSDDYMDKEVNKSWPETTAKN